MNTLLAIALGVVSLTGLNATVIQPLSTHDSVHDLAAQSISTPTNPIANTQWQLVEISGTTLPSNAQITLQFDDQNRLGGRGGCNHYGAEIQTLNSASNGQIALTISPIASTSMGCLPELMEAENRYFQALQTVRSMTVEDSTLRILAEDGTQLQLTRLSANRPVSNSNNIRTLAFFEGR